MVQWPYLETKKSLRAVEQRVLEVGGHRVIHACQAEWDIQVIIISGGLMSRRNFKAHSLCRVISICWRVMVTKENIVPVGCPERPSLELHGWDSAAKATFQVTAGYQEPAVHPEEHSSLPGCSLLLLCLPLRASTNLGAIDPSTDRECQG